jgi:hypothetical protein
MIVRHSKKPLPLKWSALPGAERALFIGHVTVSGGSRLRMKLLVFRSNRDLRSFWKKALGKGDLGPQCRGAVNGLACEVIKFKRDGSEERFMEVDPRFFCVMGLVVSHLGMEIVTHESIHAGFNYAKRVNRRDLWHNALELDEEEVCYPAGRIASGVNKLLREAGMYDFYEKRQTRPRKANAPDETPRGTRHE